jgi:hypothetical protein
MQTESYPTRPTTPAPAVPAQEPALPARRRLDRLLPDLRLPAHHRPHPGALRAASCLQDLPRLLPAGVLLPGLPSTSA